MLNLGEMPIQIYLDLLMHVFFISVCVYCLQALRVELVPYLLKLLEGEGLETVDNPSATKAQIVKALKSMTRSLQYGEQVRNSNTHTHVHTHLHSKLNIMHIFYIIHINH